MPRPPERIPAQKAKKPPVSKAGPAQPAKKPASSTARPANGSVATPAEPVPPVAPLNLNDAKACLFELAELASFPLLFDSPTNYRANAVGMDYHAHEAIQQNRKIRFDRLLEAKSLEFCKVVELCAPYRSMSGG